MRGIVIVVLAAALGASVIGAAIPSTVRGEEKANVIEAIPRQPNWRPTEREALTILEAVLGAAEETLGWDNIFYWVAVNECLLLIEEIQTAYKPGSPERYFIDKAAIDLSNGAIAMQEKINKGERVNPVGAEGKAMREKLKEIRVEVKAMIERAPVTKEPIPQWIGSGFEERRHRYRKEMLRKWLGAEGGENGDQSNAR
jgi:hypothetical protein